jgi:EmrB/QacA subfamily drug resistance transporter
VIRAAAGELAGSERAVVLTVALATLLAPLNSTMIAVALPRLAAEFGADVGAAGWLVIGYLIAMAALQPVAGSLGDRLGRRRLILGGVALFGAASLAAPLAPGLPALIGLRVLQAAGGAIALPNGTALVREVVPAERRGAAFGVIGSAIAVAAAAGPPLGGLLVELAGWRAIFLVNVPVVALALALGWWALPARPPERRPAPFDWLGAPLLAIVLGGWAVLLTRGARANPAQLAAGLLVLGLASALLLRYEAAQPRPALQPRLFRRRGFAAATSAVALSNLAMYVTLLALPLLLAAQPGWTDLGTGLVLTALSGAMVICSPVGGRLADRLGRRPPVVVGLALFTGSLLPLALTGGALDLSLLVTALGLAGAGLGLSSAGLQTAALEAVGPDEAGMASGLFSTGRYLGSIVGSAAMAGLLAAGAGFAATFVMVTLAALLSTVAGALLPGASKGSSS